HTEVVLNHRWHRGSSGGTNCRAAAGRAGRLSRRLSEAVLTAAGEKRRRPCRRRRRPGRKQARGAKTREHKRDMCTARRERRSLAPYTPVQLGRRALRSLDLDLSAGLLELLRHLFGLGLGDAFLDVGG